MTTEVAVTAPPRPSAAPLPRGDLAVAPFDEGLAIVDPVTRDTHWLDARAALVWQLLDGHTRLADTAAELAAAFDVDPSVVLSDLITTVVDLDSRGLLAKDQSQNPAEVDTRRGEHAVERSSSDTDAHVLPLTATGCSRAYDARFDWEPVLPVRAGDLIVGVRTNDRGTRERLVTLLADRLDDERDLMPAHLSVEVADHTSATVGEPLHRLCWSCTAVRTSRDLTQIVEEALGWIRCFDASARTGVLALEGLSAVRGGEAVVLSPSFAGLTGVRTLESNDWLPLPGRWLLLTRDGRSVIDPRSPDRPIPLTGWAVPERLADPRPLLADAVRRVALPGPWHTDLETLAAVVPSLPTVPVGAMDDLTRWLGKE